MKLPRRFPAIVLQPRALLSAALLLLSAYGAWTRPPNVLVLLSDDQQADAIHALGQREVITPNLDRLVTNGFAFTRAYCMGSTEPAVCAPSRAMLLTGRSLFRAVGTNHNAMLHGRILWPEVMRHAGYTTVGIGKWHNGRPAFARSFDTGGPVFFGGMSDQTRMPVYDFDPTGRYATAQQRIAEGYSSTVFANAAIDFLRQRAATNPFLLYVSFTQPHDPRMAPEKFKRLYRAETLELPRNFLPEHPFDNGELRIRDEQLLPWPRTPEALRRELADYYASISLMDAEVGRILNALDETGRIDSTIIVFASDHGLALGRHGLLGKQNLYEHSVRAPLIFCGPGFPRGQRSPALCYLFDIFPTIAEVTGLRVPEGVEGRSLLPIVTGKSPRGRASIFGAYRDVQRMIRDERWKLIRYPRINKTQLFDLERDPDELLDLSDEPAEAGRVAGMMTALERAQQEFGDTLPLTAPSPGPARVRLSPAPADYKTSR